MSLPGPNLTNGAVRHLLPELLRADPGLLRGWLETRGRARLGFCFLTIIIGAGLYGWAMGCWRAPLQGLYTGIKFPLLIFLTTLGNGLINGMLAPLLGLRLSFRQCFMAVLMTFTIASAMLGAFSPVAVFVVWNTPPLSPATSLTSPEYRFLQLTHVVFIAAAGVTGNLSLWPTLREWSGSRTVARNVLLAWLIINLLLGSQICWVLRPFIWDPSRPVEFIGPEYLRGSFYETVLQAASRLIFP